MVKEAVYFLFEQFDLLVFGFEGTAQFFNDTGRIFCSNYLDLDSCLHMCDFTKTSDYSVAYTALISEYFLKSRAVNFVVTYKQGNINKEI